jgi:iron complex transport system ATP-binding protein
MTGTTGASANSATEVAPVLEVRGLVAGYGERAVLHGVHLRVGRGELVGVIGPNGAGKSTLLKAITGVLPPAAGEVRVDGKDRARYTHAGLAQILAYVPQSEPTLFDFTVREVVLMGRHPHAGVSHPDLDYETASRAMAATDTLHLADRPITALSGGEHRRVVLARAIAQSPKLMLLDEPTAHLDVTHQADMLHLLVRMTRSDGLAALAALHDLNVASEYCDRLILLAGGRVIADDTPDAVLQADPLRMAYGSSFHVLRHPIAARPLVLPVSGETDEPAEDAPHVHVICGGGTGARLLAELARAGYRLTAGVLNRHDTDEAAAQALRVPAVREEPFSPISERRFDEALAMARGAHLVLVGPIPVGHGNMRNLELALALTREGAHLVVVDDPPITARDFTGGPAQKLWNELKDCADATMACDESVSAIVRRVLGEKLVH